MKNRLIIDFWSVPHFLAGVVTGLAASAFSWDPVVVFAATLLLAIVWEFFEKSIEVGEGLRNVISDIVLPLVAFPVTYLYAEHAVTTHERRLALLVAVLGVYTYINFIAWRARSERDGDFLND